jgi:hypothetical protein
VRLAAVQPALIDVADQEVGAALVAALPDLAKEVLDRDAGLFGAALAEVVAVRGPPGLAGTSGRAAAAPARWPGRNA